MKRNLPPRSLCRDVQIGGLTVATFITLLLVPVLHAIFVLDLKFVKWEGKSNDEGRYKYGRNLNPSTERHSL